MCCVDHGGDGLEIHIGVGADEGDFFGTLQIDSCEHSSRFHQSTFSSLILIFGACSFAVQITWMTTVRSTIGSDFASCFGGCGVCAFFPYSGSIETTSMNMMVSVSSTSMSGVTLICGLDTPPPAIEKAMSVAPLGHACLVDQTP